MELSNMKNMIVLKNLPSNTIEEAIVILKENKKIKNYKYMKEKCKEENIKNKDRYVHNVNNTSGKLDKNVNKKNEKDYILKEAEMIISSYITKLETMTPKWKNNMEKLEKRYKKSIKLNFILGFITIISFILSVV